jgi:hypothetical protein
MTTTETARAIYEQETQGEKKASKLAADLEKRADELTSEDKQKEVTVEQSGMRDEVRDEIADAMQNATPEQNQEAAAQLDEAAGDIRSTLGKHDPTMKDLPGNIAGQAQLQSSNMSVDTGAIQGSGKRIINKKVAADIGKHEARHQEQSATADATEVTLGKKEPEVAEPQNADAKSLPDTEAEVTAGTTTLDATELREFDAMEAQDDLGFVSGEYKAIHAKAAAVLSGSDRELIKAGKFKELERRHAVEDQAVAA